MTVSNRGQSLELFFIDGKPDGMLTAEMFNWAGHILMTPRTNLSEALKRSEAKYTGVYLLIGQQDEEPMAYIGMGEDISDRIKNHDAKKDWWDIAVIIASKANNLNKVHAGYLEARLIEEALSIGRIKLENGNTPSRPSLSEAERSNMETFLEYLLMVLPALRVENFVKNIRPSTEVKKSDVSNVDGPVFQLKLKKENIEANAILSEGEFVVQAGSVARKSWVGDRKEKTSYWKLFDELVDQGILIDAGDHRTFSENYAFKSTSAAGAVVNGRSTRGPTDWKVKETKKTYSE
jgi:hypothetical protein